jgi:Fic family protein
MISLLIREVEEKKAGLDRLRPLSPHALASLEHAYDLELTYTSNAIEGNTLTQIETSLVVEKGVTIGGKSSRIISKRSITTTPSAMSATSRARRRA